jgi:bacillithiol biosynthesis deacetylase BshB1
MKLDALAIGAHPDDVELGCGATVAQLAAAGRKVGIVHLTRGEAGTRGTPQQRQAEAERAAEALGAAELAFLDCGDAALRTGEPEEDALIALLRRWRPELVLGPTPVDRHPDHGRAHQLVAAACFYAGLAGRGAGEPFRPGAAFSYMQHDPFEPSFIVAVGEAAWRAKQRALDAYQSQLYQPERDGEADPGGDEPITKVATRDFRLGVDGRARHFGQMVGATWGEPFWSPRPPVVSDPFDLLPGGVR